MNLFKTLERLFVAVVYAESGDNEMAERIATEHKRNTKASNRQKSKSVNRRPQLRA